MKKPPECEKCILTSLDPADGSNLSDPLSFIPPTGHCTNKKVLMGMAPAKDEVREGKPFVGRAGQVLETTLRVIGEQRDNFLIMNTLQCRPPSDNWSGDEWWAWNAIRQCASHRDKYIAEVKPDVIVALGNVPFKLLTGEDGILKKRGYVYWSKQYNCKVIGSYHPAYVGRGNMNLIQYLAFDIAVAAERPIPEWPLSQLVLNPTAGEFERWADEELQRNSQLLVVDIETPYSKNVDEDSEDFEDDPSTTIIRLSFCTDRMLSITVPWEQPFLATIRKLLGSALPKVLWNGDYDIPRLEINGFPVNGQIIDAMWLFHFLFPDLPKNLANATTVFMNLPEWKSKGSSNPELYSAMDSYAEAGVYLGLVERLKKEGMWDIAYRHVILFMNLLRQLRKRGLRIDREKLDAFKLYLAKRLDEIQAELDEKVPEEVRVKEWVKAKHLRGRCECVSFAIGKKGKPIKKLVPMPTCGLCQGTGWNAPFYTLAKFNPCSKDQVEAYCHLKGYKLGKVKDKKTGEKKESTAQKFLEVLLNSTGDPILRASLDYREVNTVATRYAKWKIDADGRVRTKLGIDTGTGRLQSMNPNMQNIPREGELAEAFKECIIPSDGHIIFRRDYTGIEAFLVGYFAGDAEYMRLARLGVHNYATLRKLGQHVDLHAKSDAELREDFKRVKKDHYPLYNKVKRTIHATNFMATWKRIMMENPGTFESVKECKDFTKFCQNLSQKVKTWQKKTVEKVGRTKRLWTPFHYNRWFFDFPGDGPAAVASGPQSTAAAVIKEAMLRIADNQAGEFMVLQVHDELIFDLPIGPGSCTCHHDNKLTWQQYDELYIKPEMERSIPELEGLVVKTEGSSGRSLNC